MISQRARYALKALAALARAHPEQGLQIRDLSARQHIPRKFLEQILLALKAGGLVASRRGREGGYHLCKPEGSIVIGQVVRLMDGPMAPLPCLSRTAYRQCLDCSEEGSCPVRHAFADGYAAYLEKLERMTLAKALSLSQNAGATINGVR